MGRKESNQTKQQMRTLTLCTWEAPKGVLLQTVKSQMKCSMMLNFIWDITVCKGKKVLRQKIQYFFLKYDVTPLDMYIGLSQVYCIKLERGDNPLVYKALAQDYLIFVLISQ